LRIKILIQNKYGKILKEIKDLKAENDDAKTKDAHVNYLYQRLKKKKKKKKKKKTLKFVKGLNTALKLWEN